MDKKFTKKYIAIIRCKKCGEEIELECDNTEAITHTYTIRHSGHICPKRLSDTETIYFDLVSIRDNENYGI